MSSFAILSSFVAFAGLCVAFYVHFSTKDKKIGKKHH